MAWTSEGMGANDQSGTAAQNNKKKNLGLLKDRL